MSACSASSSTRSSGRVAATTATATAASRSRARRRRARDRGRRGAAPKRRLEAPGVAAVRTVDVRDMEAPSEAEPLSPTRALLVCSSGGHLAQLVQLRPWWESCDRVWFTFDTEDVKSALEGEQVVFAHSPTTRNIPNALRNVVAAWRLLRRYRPDIVVSTGAGVAFPTFVVAKLLRIPTVFVEVYDRIDTPTLTGRLCQPLSSLFLVQWEDQLAHYRRAQL